MYYIYIYIIYIYIYIYHIYISDISYDLHSAKQEMIYYKGEQNRITNRYSFIVCILENFSQ